MKPELVMLLWAVALTFAQVLIATIGAMLPVPPEAPPPPSFIPAKPAS